MKHAKLPRPRGAGLSPDVDAPPELAALAANLRARFAFWADVHARDALFERGGFILMGAPFSAVVDAAGGLDDRGRVTITPETLARAADAAGNAAGLGESGADIIAARVIRRTVEGIAPRKLWRALLQRPSLAWRYPLAPVRDATGERAMVAASYLDNAATVKGSVMVPSYAGTAERVKLPPRHSVALYGADDPPPEVMVDATRCVPIACIVPPVKLSEVLGALRASPDPDARAAADIIERHAAETNPARELRDAGLAPWGPYCVAAVLCTLQELRAVHGRHDTFAFPTTRESNAALVHFAAGSKPSAWKGTPQRIDPATGEPSARKVVLRVQWEGKILQTQLCLELGEDVTGEALAAVLDHMGDDGLRTWLAIHALAHEQGNTGEVRWTWPDHKRVATLAPRIAACGTTKGGTRETDDALRRSVVRDLWQLTRAALWEDSGKRMRRVGDGPFTTLRAIGDPEGLEQERDDFTAALLHINRVLYRGAHRDARASERHFTGITPAVFALRGGALRLAVFILRAERVHRDDGLRVRFTERELMRYARVRGDGKPPAKHMAAARAELARYVAEAVGAFNQGETPGSLAAMTPNPSEPGVYQWTPARWRVEREQLGAAMERPALPPADRPYTGAALRAWREARELSQRDAARVLKVGFRTVQRAEIAADEPLPRSFHRAGMAWGITPADAAQLGAGEEGPVEGEDDQGGDARP